MFKKVLIIIAVFLFAVVVSGCAKTTANKNTNSVSAVDIVTGAADIKIKEKADKDLAVAKAKELWRIQFQMEADLSAGPCLSNSVIPDWVADIAHSPRQDVDNLPANQCSAYRDGTAHHFVELDPAGNLIRAQ
jgi:hypothetical protein